MNYILQLLLTRSEESGCMVPYGHCGCIVTMLMEEIDLNQIGRRYDDFVEWRGSFGSDS